MVQYHISLEVAAGIFRGIKAKNGRITTPLGPLETAAMTPVPAYFVPKSSTVTIPVNSLLKNNFRGSMVSEWFGGQSRVLRMLKAADLQKAVLRIQALLPIGLFTRSDHIGNVLFQFPQEIAFCKLSHMESGFTCSVTFDERVRAAERYALSVFTAHDELLMDHHAATGKGGGDLTLDLSDTGGPYVIALTDTEHGIPILRQGVPGDYLQHGYQRGHAGGVENGAAGRAGRGKQPAWDRSALADPAQPLWIFIP